jgi:hypothetical protein
VEFLEREKHDELLEPVRFKAKLDCMEEALALKNYLAENDVKDAKKNKNDSTAAAGATKEKRPAFKAPEKISKEKFYAKRREYYKAVKESEEYKKLIDDWKKVQEDTLKRAAQYAKDNNLVKSNTRFANNFYDPKSEYLKGDDFFWITVAGNYKPTDKTPKKAVEEIRDTGLTMGVRDEDSDVHILDHIITKRAKKTDDGGRKRISFDGTRRRGNTDTRNGEIAFVNEYGKRGQPARPFMRTALEQNAELISEPGEKIIGDWIENEYKK